MRLTSDDYKKIASGDPEILHRIEHVVKICARAGASKSGFEYLVDDIYQELWILLISKLAGKFDPTFALEPILIESARRIALGEGRKRMRGGLVYFDGSTVTDLAESRNGLSPWASNIQSYVDPGERHKSDVSESEFKDPYSARFEDGADEIIEDMDRRKLMDQIFTKCPGLIRSRIKSGSEAPKTAKTPNIASADAPNQEPSPEQIEPSTGLNARKRGRPVKPKEVQQVKHVEVPLYSKRVWPTSLAGQGTAATFPDASGVLSPPKLEAETSEEGLLLSRCRKKFGLTQVEMALHLNLPHSTYLSYEYARVRTVPAEILSTVKAMLEEDNEHETWFEKYKGMTMVQISDQWARRLDVDPSNVTEFALRLGIHKSTVSRWRTGDQQPTMRSILTYEKAVERIENRMKRSVSPGLSNAESPVT